VLFFNLKGTYLYVILLDTIFLLFFNLNFCERDDIFRISSLLFFHRKNRFYEQHLKITFIISIFVEGIILSMSAEITYKKLLPLAKYWLKELDFYGTNQFKRKVTDKSWTIGQIYDHLLIYSQEVHLKAIQECLYQKDADAKQGKSFKGITQFLVGSYLPFKYKSNPYKEPGQPLSTEKVKDDFYRFLKLVYKVAKEIDYKKPTSKVKHPTLGYLTAEEWFQLMEMHFRHHLKQKKKLDVEVRSNTKETEGKDFDDIPDMPYHEL